MMRAENLRASKLFHDVSISKVNKECEGQLVENHVALLQSECRQMIKDENTVGKFLNQPLPLF